MLYLAPPEFRRKYAAPIRAGVGIVLLAVGIALNSLFVLILGGLFIVLAIVGFAGRLMR
jgi:small-conductance mechanosensitive channel